MGGALLLVILSCAACMCHLINQYNLFLCRSWMHSCSFWRAVVPQSFRLVMEALFYSAKACWKKPSGRCTLL